MTCWYGQPWENWFLGAHFAEIIEMYLDRQYDRIYGKIFIQNHKNHFGWLFTNTFLSTTAHSSRTTKWPQNWVWHRSRNSGVQRKVIWVRRWVRKYQDCKGKIMQHFRGSGNILKPSRNRRMRYWSNLRFYIWQDQEFFNKIHGAIHKGRPAKIGILRAPFPVKNNNTCPDFLSF